MAKYLCYATRRCDHVLGVLEGECEGQYFAPSDTQTNSLKTTTLRVPTAPGKAGKMTTVFPGNVLEFYNFIKNPGKMGVNLEK